VKNLNDREIDKLHGITRKPAIGCLISIIGTITFWSIVYHLIT
jgi:hypothetical protein